MALELKENQIKNSFYVVGVSYCELQHLLNYFTRTGYTCGVYGWKSDFFQIQNSNRGISTGYAPIQNIKINDAIKRRIIKKYDDKARIYSDKFTDYKKLRKQAEKDLAAFIREIWKNATF